MKPLDENNLLLFLKQSNLDVDHIERMVAGGNNVIYRAFSAHGSEYALKHYSPLEAVMHERMQREFSALTWMQQHHMDCVPKPYCYDVNNRVAVYSWVSGDKLKQISSNHLNELVRFLEKLYKASHHHNTLDFDLAKDACLSAQDVLDVLKNRFSRLSNAGIEQKPVCDFVTQQCAQLLHELTVRLHEIYNEHGLDIAQPISQQQRTLSPSDYGFHNALVGGDDKLTFIDFEYFGWDDPVKMVSDFLWHPGQQLNSVLKLQFEQAMIALFSGDTTFNVRMKALYPLYGLIWVLIVLNNFIPSVWSAKVEAGVVTEANKQHVLQHQFEKAYGLYSQVNDVVVKESI